MAPSAVAGVASSADIAEVASSADLAGLVTVGVTYSAVVEVAPSADIAEVAPSADIAEVTSSADIAEVASSADLAEDVTVGVAFLVVAGVASSADIADVASLADLADVASSTDLTGNVTVIVTSLANPASVVTTGAAFQEKCDVPSGLVCDYDDYFLMDIMTIIRTTLTGSLLLQILLCCLIVVCFRLCCKILTKSLPGTLRRLVHSVGNRRCTVTVYITSGAMASGNAGGSRPELTVVGSVFAVSYSHHGTRPSQT